MLDLPQSVRDSLVGKTCLVTGGAGFIGSHLAKALLQCGAKVRIIDDLSTGVDVNIPLGSEFTKGSILDRLTMERVAQGCQVVFHLAAKTSVPESVMDPCSYARVNIMGTQRALEIAKLAGVKRFIFASSSAVYGDRDDDDLPADEFEALEPASPYAASKVAGEALCRAFAMCYAPLDAICLRYFNVYGAGQSSLNAPVIMAFLDAARRGIPPVIFGDGGQARDFVHVDDVVRANLMAAASPEWHGGYQYNVGTGVETTMCGLIKILHDAGADVMSPIFQPGRAADIRKSCAETRNSARELGFNAVVNFSTGIARLLKG